MEGLIGHISSHQKPRCEGSENGALAAKVRIMSDPALYQSRVEVETIETHFSWVFLVAGAVYKLKKPLKKSYLDLSSLGLRRQNCETEVRLNRRLTHDVYLGVEALTIDSTGRVHLSRSPSSAEILDFVVHQRRLDPSQGMGNLLKQGALKSHHAESLMEHLVAFYSRQPPIGWNGDTYLSRLRAELTDCLQAFREIQDHEIHLPFSLITHLEQYLQVAGGDLTRTAVLARIVEGHGDLRPEHVFFEEGPQIIDCLEFSYDLRCRDALDEIAYLAMECSILGHGDVGDYLVETFQKMAHIKCESHIWHFYAAFRAMVRAKLVAWRLVNGHGADLERWRKRLWAYWSMAEKYTGLF